MHNLGTWKTAMTALTLRILEARKILLRCCGTKICDLNRQLMLIYLADRECWQRLGKPLIPGPILATYEYGPVNMNALKLLKSEPRHEFFFQELSKAEVGILHRVSIACQRLSNDELHARAHQLPEWRIPLLAGGDVIPLEHVLMAVGYSCEDAIQIAIGHDSMHGVGQVAVQNEALDAVA